MLSYMLVNLVKIFMQTELVFMQIELVYIQFFLWNEIALSDNTVLECLLCKTVIFFRNHLVLLTDKDGWRPNG